MKNRGLKYFVACLAAVVMAIAGAGRAAQAAAPTAPVFPVGSRIGLVPPQGMVPSKTFPGFVDPAENAGIVISTLPADAYSDMKSTLTDEALKQRGMTVEKRQSLQLRVGNGDLVIGTQVGPDKATYRKWLLLVPTAEFTIAVTMQAPARDRAYSNDAVTAALASLAMRPKVPEAELLKLLPFTVGDFSGFQIGNVIPGRALLLLDAPKNPHLVATGALPEYEFNARFIITALPGAPSDPQERASLAHDAFTTIAGLKEVQITMAEPVRLDNGEGFETVASAKDADSGASLMVVQWLRFGGGGSLQMIGISRVDLWDEELSRMRNMRDSIAIK